MKKSITALAVLAALLMIPMSAADQERYFDPVAYHAQHTAFPQTQYFDPWEYHARFTAYPSPEVVTEQILAIWRQYEKTVMSGDIDGWLALWTEDGIQMPPNTVPRIGKAQIHDAQVNSFENSDIPVFRILNEEVTVSGELAYARGTYQATVVSEQGAEPLEIDGKYMTVFKKAADGAWKIHRDIFNSNY